MDMFTQAYTYAHVCTNIEINVTLTPICSQLCRGTQSTLWNWNFFNLMSPARNLDAINWPDGFTFLPKYMVVAVFGVFFRLLLALSSLLCLSFGSCT